MRGASESGTQVAVRTLGERERAVVRTLQGNIAVRAAPFADVAQATGWTEAELLGLLAGWQGQGVLRRVGIILRHRQAGFVANGMCVWRVPPADVARAGRAVAAAPEVTHCYEPAKPQAVPVGGMVNRYADVGDWDWFTFTLP